MRLGFGKNSRKFYVFSNNYIFIQYQHNQQEQWHISYDVIHSILPKAGKSKSKSKSKSKKDLFR